MKHFRKIIGICFIALILIVMMGTILGETANDQKNQLQKIENENEALEKKKQEAHEQINRLDDQVAKVSASLNQTNEKLVDTEKKIEQTAIQLKNAQESVDAQYQDMKVRIQYMYENGDTQMIDLLFHSDSITDFMDKMEYITELSRYDRNMLNRMLDMKKKIANAKKELEARKSDLESFKKEQKASVDQLIQLSKSKQQEVKTYEGLISENEKHAQELENEIAAMEKAAAVAREKQENQATSGQTIPHHRKGKFAWPLPGHSNISSDYGDTQGRSSGHNGIDITAPAGTPIVAAGSGIVAWANYSSSAGNWVGIDHGNGVYTVYMHMSALGVMAGQSITQGQTIGYVGTTGYSTGNHLHFGVRVNGSWVNPWNYL